MPVDAATLKIKVDITEREAYHRFVAMEKPTLRGLAVLLNAEGIKIDKSTIIRWAKQNCWQEKRTNFDFMNAAVHFLPKAAARLTPDMIKGLRASICYKLTASIAKMKIDTPQDAKVMLAVMVELASFEHDLRGQEIADKTAEEADEPPTPEKIMEDAPQMGPFLQRPKSGTVN